MHRVVVFIEAEEAVGTYLRLFVNLLPAPSPGGFVGKARARAFIMPARRGGLAMASSPRVAAALAAILLSMAAGCVAPSQGAPSAEEAGAAPVRPVVVAVLDTGINPYHEAFRADPGAGVERFADAFGAEVLRLSGEGTYEERRDADEALWDGLEPGRLYAFAGTRVLAASLSVPEGDPLVLDVEGHGTGVAGMAAREAPGALVLMLQVDVEYCSTGDPAACELGHRTSNAMAWAAEQPWIDVVTTSLTYPANPPSASSADPDVAAYVAASRLAHDRGKVLVNAAGNSPTPSAASQFAGPPWVIAVGGAQPSQRSEALESSRAVDLVANYTDLAPAADSVDAYEWVAGTSFGTPLVAGTLANAIARVREARGDAGPVATKDLRDALNATAVHFAATDYDASGQPTNDTVRNAYLRGVPVVVPFAQMGWGYAHGGMAEEIARRVLEGDLAPPPEKALAAEYQARWQAAREDYWARQQA